MANLRQGKHLQIYFWHIYPQLGPAQQPHRCPLNKNKYFHNKTGNISRLAAARVPNVPAAARYLLELSTGLFSQCRDGREIGTLVQKINNIINEWVVWLAKILKATMLTC